MASLLDPYATPTNPFFNDSAAHLGNQECNITRRIQGSDNNDNLFYGVISWITIGIYMWTLISNISVAIAILTRKKLRSLPYYQILNISLTGIIFTTAALSIELANHFIIKRLSTANTWLVRHLCNNLSVRHIPQVYQESTFTLTEYAYFPLCELVFGILFTSFNASTFTLVSISVQHYLAAKTSQYQLITTKRLILVNIVIWLFAIILSMPYSALTIQTYYNTSSSRICAFAVSRQSQFIIIYTIAFIAIGLVVPYVILCFCYAVVIYKLRHGIQLRSQNGISWNVANSEHDNQYDRKAKAGIRLIVVITLVYIMSLSPYSVGIILAAMAHYFAQSSLSTQHWNATLLMPTLQTQAQNKDTETQYGSGVGILFAIAIVCLSIFFASMPIVYVVFNQKLRKEFKNGLSFRSYFHWRKTKVTVLAKTSKNR